MANSKVAEAKEAAKKKITAAKREAEYRKKLKQIPRLEYVDMPEYTGNPEVDSKADLDAVKEGFRKRAKNEAERFALVTDSGYWFCMCFQSREQSNAFLKALDLLDIGDLYLDGVEVAERLGIELPEANVPYNTSEKRDKAWLEFVEPQS